MTIIKKLLFIILITSNITMCSKNDKPYVFDDFCITFDNIFKIEEKEYSILFYLDYCLSCKYIFERIEFQKLYLKYKIYYVDLMSLPRSALDYQKDNVGVNSKDEIHLISSPTILKIKEGEVIKQLNNLDEIRLEFDFE